MGQIQTITALVQRPVKSMPNTYLPGYEKYRDAVWVSIFCSERRALLDDVYPLPFAGSKSRKLVAETLDFTKHKLDYSGTDCHYLRSIQNKNDTVEYDFKTRCEQLHLYCQQIGYQTSRHYKYLYDIHYVKIKYVMEIDDVNGKCLIFREAEKFKHPKFYDIAEYIRNILYT